MIDSINNPIDLINRAIELGLSGIAITDHESLSSHVKVNQYAKKIREKNPDFTIALGNEIYLVDERKSNQKYHHFILLAKDAIGHKQLRKLSTTAWLSSYVDRKNERVPLLKKELQEEVEKNPNHLIMTTACLGGKLGFLLFQLFEHEKNENVEMIQKTKEEIVDFLSFCKNLAGDDFYLEVSPAETKEQIEVNKRIYNLSKCLGIKMCLGSDAHYLKKEDRYEHKTYLNSASGGDREVDSFYEFTYLMSAQEAREHLRKSFDDNVIDEIFQNTLEIKGKITFYDLYKKQIIPKVEVKDYNKNYDRSEKLKRINCPIYASLFISDNIQERYWANETWNGLEKKLKIENLFSKQEYIERIEIEADVIDDIGKKLEDCLFAYFNTFQHFINLFWECGSIVGPGRGSATGYITNYAMGITQLDSIKWNLPWYRFLNKERAELPDIDVDLCPSKRQLIFEKIREERGLLGISQVATFGTETSKSVILSSARGYRSEEYPDGIDIDTAQYMSSLIPSTRGFLWSIEDVAYGDGKDRKPIKEFIDEVQKYPNLLETMLKLESVVNKRSSHASGVILYREDPFETAAFMKTPSGDIITQYDLHDAEYVGDTKYDFLATEASDKIVKCIELLQEYNKIPKDTLRNSYDNFLHPEILDTTDPKLWEHLQKGDILDIFQFDGTTGRDIAKKLAPQNPIEMTSANALMRLMTEKGEEPQQDRYLRIKNNPSVFEQEMNAHNLTEKQKLALHKHCDKYYGTVPLQEQMMEILMDEDIASFTLGEANSARKTVAKKKMNEIPALRELVYEKISNESFADYIWKLAIQPSLGYAFSLNHSLPYSFVGLQMIYLASNFNPIYWNTSCLIVNSGAIDAEQGGQTKYEKIAKAINNIRNRGIQVSLADINNSSFGFVPDEEKNQIIFGLKGMLNVGDDLINEIICNRPYSSWLDFYNKIKPNKQAMIALIKGGAFDQFKSRKRTMAEFIWYSCDKKKRLTLQNMGSLIKYNLLPQTKESQKMLSFYEFNRYLKNECKNSKEKSFFTLDDRAFDFLAFNDLSSIVQCEYGTYLLNNKVWDKIYQTKMDFFREWINKNKENILNDLNAVIFTEDWKKYCGKGNISSWEMEVLCFYYHEHELSNIDYDKYGFSNFFELSEEPEVEKSFYKGKHKIDIFKLHKICGTCISKDKMKSIVYISTREGVVPIRFRKEYFSLFDKQISQKQPDGTKKVIEKSWFNRGRMIIVQGIRRGDDFIPKKYSKTIGHQLYLIEDVTEKGDLSLIHNRAKGEIDEEED